MIEPKARGQKSLVVFSLLSVAMFAVSCAPKIYVVDRQTVLEEEAAGSWPDFEKQVIEGSKTSGPTPFKKVPQSEQRAKLYNILNGSMQ